ncbi:hypothetical protein [Sphingobium cupriresistens]|uniref:Uncharacterized protein n=1 Tax=Sphingobium cupriresistens LL01 TaxID=1420583 RepID=A0A0J7Y5N3_9SPHN|nr:hypothetical protein [Sphingobium cupriresistens]KMS58698.1 hypothetical protein V473_02620 [Sphingobium cupriresistens LL01]
MTIAENEGLRAEIASLLMGAGMRPVPDKLIRDIIAKVESDLVRNSSEAPHLPTPEMIAVAWDVIDKGKLAGGIKRLGPGLGVAEIWQAMTAVAPETRP